MPNEMDYEMPAAPEAEGEEVEMDLFGDEESEAGPLAEFSDEDLIEELKVRGFDIEEEGSEESEELPEMPAPEDELAEDII